jgi:hypothetical protein
LLAALGKRKGLGASPEGLEVLRIDPQTLQPARALLWTTVFGRASRLQAPGPARIRTGLGAVWVVNGMNRTLARIDPQSNHVSAVISLKHETSRVEIGNDAVWAFDTVARTKEVPVPLVTRVDPRTNQPQRFLSWSYAGISHAATDEYGYYAIDDKSTSTTCTPPSCMCSAWINEGRKPLHPSCRHRQEFKRLRFKIP